MSSKLIVNLLSFKWKQRVRYDNARNNISHWDRANAFITLVPGVCGGVHVLLVPRGVMPYLNLGH